MRISWIGTIVPIRRPKLKKNRAPPLKQILQAISRIIRERQSEELIPHSRKEAIMYIYYLS